MASPWTRNRTSSSACRFISICGANQRVPFLPRNLRSSDAPPATEQAGAGRRDEGRPQAADPAIDQRADNSPTIVSPILIAIGCCGLAALFTRRPTSVRPCESEYSGLDSCFRRNERRSLVGPRRATLSGTKAVQGSGGQDKPGHDPVGRRAQGCPDCLAQLPSRKTGEVSMELSVRGWSRSARGPSTCLKRASLHTPRSTKEWAGTTSGSGR